MADSWKPGKAAGPSAPHAMHLPSREILKDHLQHGAQSADWQHVLLDDQCRDATVGKHAHNHVVGLQRFPLSPTPYLLVRAVDPTPPLLLNINHQ